jgi:hypothetical protein
VSARGRESLVWSEIWGERKREGGGDIYIDI